jgi:hypothetical protein
MRALLRPYASAMASLLALGMAALPLEDAPAAGGVAAARRILAEEEDLLYEVSWTVIKIGTIRLRTFTNGTAEADIDSYNNIPFVDLHSVHWTRMDSLFYSAGSRSLEKEDEGWWGLDYVSDLPHGIVRVDETMQKDLHSEPYKRTVKDSLRLEGTHFVDGLSIAYLPRRLAQTHHSVSVPTILYGKLGTTRFDLPGTHVREELKVLGHQVKMIEIQGTTTVEGIFGMTGDFQGWFSDDSLAVPLKGKLKVLIGNVSIELIAWKRKGWSPPE